LVNSFRQLTLPWLVALVLMLVFTGLWYQFEMKSQHRTQIEQLATTLQLSIRPLLKNKDAELVQAQLNHMRYASALPLTSIAIFSQDDRVLVSAGPLESLQQFTINTPVTAFSIQSSNNMLLALQPLTLGDGTMAREPQLRSAEEQYFMLLLFESVTSHSSWLLPMLIVGLLGSAVLVLIKANLAQTAQRLQTDVSLIGHKLSQLKNGQQNVRLNEQLVPELASIKPVLNELAKVHADTTDQFAKSSEYSKHQAALAQQHNVSLQQQVNIAQQNFNALQHTAQHRMQSLQQLVMQQAELDEKVFAPALLAQLSLLQLELNPAPGATAAVNLTDLLASQRSDWQSLLAGRNIDLQLFEGADNTYYDIESSAQQISSLLLAMLALASGSQSVSELILRVRLDNTVQGAVLHLSITGNGEGISSRLRQLLSSHDPVPLPWQESHAGIFMALKRQLNATVSIQAIDGLGCTIAINFPVTIARAVSVARMQHLLLCESPLSSLNEHGQAMAPLAAQIAKCADLAELTLKSKQHLFDVAIIILPAPAELAQWRQVLQELNRRSQLLCYAASPQLAVWREALQMEVQPGPVLLADLQTFSKKQRPLPRLLVVDDNPTNLAFVQVLLKEQPVQLYTVSCGADTIKMCQQHQFDVILLDIQLPDITGTEVARQLRQLSGYQFTPILAFTAHALEEEISSFLQAGMDDIILKPLEAAKLEQILHWCSIGQANDVSRH
jgi:two-component system, NarL family, sensor histidine kinase BarA